jgi:hypothetical protein
MKAQFAYHILWNASCDGASVHAKYLHAEVDGEKLEFEEFKKRHKDWSKELDLDKFVDVFYENVVVYGMPDHTVDIAGKEFPTEEIVGMATWDDPNEDSILIVESVKK